MDTTPFQREIHVYWTVAIIFLQYSFFKCMNNIRSVTSAINLMMQGNWTISKWPNYLFYNDLIKQELAWCSSAGCVQWRTPPPRQSLVVTPGSNSHPPHFWSICRRKRKCTTLFLYCSCFCPIKIPLFNVRQCSYLKLWVLRGPQNIFGFCGARPNIDMSQWPPSPRVWGWDWVNVKAISQCCMLALVPMLSMVDRDSILQ